ncbi:MAG: SpoIIE family protein phosphatase [Planctomycetota bacterium]|nr:SpoIIE family protein phosphatase [Planctomycetota bacterium]
MNAPSMPYQINENTQPMLDRLASKKLMVFCIVLLALGVANAGWFFFTDLALLVQVAQAAPDSQAESAQAAVTRGWARMGGFAAAMLTIVYFLAIQRKRLTTYKQVIDNASLMIVLIGALMLASRLVLQSVFPTMAAWGIMDLMIVHLAACLILPWSPKESVIPFIPLLLVWAMVVLIPDVGEWEIFDRVVVVIMSPIILAPGALITSWRRKRSQEDLERIMLGEQVRSIGGELSRARIVHDAMFPKPYDDGHVCFEFEYVPIHEIGGDYVHFHRCRISGRIYLTLLDVAGHGLAAALTVNRLFGELERIRAEDPNAGPSEVMALLNRYINLTMARHNLYATGACFMLDPSNGTLHWVNAGHPPSLLRRADGRVFDMKGTTMLLGAQTYAEFDPNMQTITLSPGDVVIAYTDGAFEARDDRGKRFGIDRLRETLLFDPPPRCWTRFISTAVEKHHGGNAEDDVLIASLALRSLQFTNRSEGEGASDEITQSDVPSQASTITSSSSTPSKSTTSN